MTWLNRVRSILVWLLPFLAAVAVGLLVAASGFVVVEALISSEERHEQTQDLSKQADDIQALLDIAQADREELERQLANLESRFAAMLGQHDGNDQPHLRPPPRQAGERHPHHFRSENHSDD